MVPGASLAYLASVSASSVDVPLLFVLYIKRTASREKLLLRVASRYLANARAVGCIKPQLLLSNLA
jgi:hypothetical protein